MNLLYSILLLELLVGCKPKTTGPAVPVVDEESGASADDSYEDEETDDGESEETDEETESSLSDTSTSTSTSTRDEASGGQTSVITKVDQSFLFATLDSARFEMRCDKDPGTGYDCPISQKVDKTLVVNGDASSIYTVEIRVRGVVEPMTYSGGTREGANLAIGSIPSNTNFSYYKMTVSAPYTEYYLNAFDAVGGFVAAIDYTTKIKVKGGASIKLFADSQNGSQMANKGFVTVSSLATPADLKYGQYVQINVMSATKNQ